MQGIKTLWTQKMEEQHIDDAQLMEKLHITEPKRYDDYLTSTKIRIIQQMRDALNVSNEEIRPFVRHKLRNKPQTKAEFFDDLCYRHLITQADLKRLIDIAQNRIIEQIPITFKRAEILNRNLNVNIYDLSQFSKFPLTSEPKSFRDYFQNYLFIKDYSVGQGLKACNMPASLTLTTIDEWFERQSPKMQEKIMNKINYLPRIKEWATTSNTLNDTKQSTQPLKNQSTGEKPMDKPKKSEPVYLANRTSGIRLENKISQEEKSHLYDTFKKTQTESKSVAVKTEPTTIVTQTVPVSRTSTTAYAEIAQILIKKVKDGLLTVKIVQEDFPIVYQAYQKEFEQIKAQKFNDLTKLLNDTLPLVYKDKILNMKDRELLKMMLDGIASNKTN